MNPTCRVGLRRSLVSVTDTALPLTPSDAQFILGGYSWRKKDFCIWTFYYEQAAKAFKARPAKAFDTRLRKAAFIGDWATRFRARLSRELADSRTESPVNKEPLRLLGAFLKAAPPDSSIGGAPQVVRVGPHMNARPFCVRWGGDRTPFLFGRALFDYENCDYWTIDPETGKVEAPRHFKLDKEAHFED